MAYSASIEWMGLARECGVLRVHPLEAGSHEFGDPYVWSAFLHRFTPEGVVFKGVVGPPPLGAREAINDAMHRDGLRHYSHERHPGTDRGRVIVREILPPRPER